MHLSLRVKLLALLLALFVAALAAGALTLTQLARGEAGGWALWAGPLLLLVIFLCVGLLVDHGVARPLERLAGELQRRAHGREAPPLDPRIAPELGDLGPAAAALEAALREARGGSGGTGSEAARFEELLADLPLPLLLTGPDGRVVLFNGQAAGLFAQGPGLRLGTRLDGLVTPASLAAAQAKADRSGLTTSARLDRAEGAPLNARLQHMADGGYLLAFEQAAPADTEGCRPLVHDFALCAPAPEVPLADRPLSELRLCVLHLETTGPLPHRDTLTCIEAQMLCRGAARAGESYKSRVEAGTLGPAARGLAEFAQGAVIVAQNAPLEMAFLRARRAETGLDWDLPVLDIVALAALVFGPGPRMSFASLRERLGVSPREGQLAARVSVTLRLLQMLEGRGVTTYGDLCAALRASGREAPTDAVHAST
ncbi:hypothetical protein LR948_04870 [Roseivivax sp. GX 12232]|uniref:3'-5' exonuclease n=1 Tax=Roseivivax sp. GX 12232 TaxID=2900547 RepID=UPI001E422F4E|nr:hypothetical protein [Roseivivax sp. GX 12232]MCE0504673.1 hypothetical protein [Roseivivax sp. GX 12232]